MFGFNKKKPLPVEKPADIPVKEEAKDDEDESRFIFKGVPHIEKAQDELTKQFLDYYRDKRPEIDLCYRLHPLNKPKGLVVPKYLTVRVGEIGVIDLLYDLEKSYKFAVLTKDHGVRFVHYTAEADKLNPADQVIFSEVLEISDYNDIYFGSETRLKAYQKDYCQYEKGKYLINSLK